MTSLGTDNVAVETGHNHTVVLKSNGTVWTAGLNSDGQLGDWNHHPAQVAGPGGGLADAVGIAAGRNMTYAIRSNGTLWGWGRNDAPQLGDGTLTRRLAPVRVGTLSDVTAVTGAATTGSPYSVTGALGPGARTTTARSATGPSPTARLRRRSSPAASPTWQRLRTTPTPRTAGTVASGAATTGPSWATEPALHGVRRSACLA